MKDVSATPQNWRSLCGQALAICGTQDVFRKESNILKRLVRKFGPDEVEFMLLGAKHLGWTSLRSLGSQDGLGRRWALEAYWRHQNTRRAKLPQSLGDILLHAMAKP